MRLGFKWLGTLFLLFLVLSCLGPSLWPFELLFYLGTGWLLFLGRIGSQITVSYGGIATGIIALALFAFGTHWMLKWLYATKQMAGETSEHLRIWSARWTASIVCAIVLMFVAGTAMVGITHQVTWLATSEVPLTQYPRREKWRNAQSSANLKQIALALNTYASQHDSLPAGGTFDDQGRALHSWQTALLPYIEQDHLYEQINHDLPWDSPDNAKLFGNVVPLFTNPGAYPNEENDYGLSHYAANPLVLGGGSTIKPADIKDGAGQTLVTGEVAENFRPWGYPANWRDPRLGINRSPNGFGGPWRKTLGANFAFADGSVQFLSAEIDPDVFHAMCTPSGGEETRSAIFDE